MELVPKTMHHQNVFIRIKHIHSFDLKIFILKYYYNGLSPSICRFKLVRYIYSSCDLSVLIHHFIIHILCAFYMTRSVFNFFIFFAYFINLVYFVFIFVYSKLYIFIVVGIIFNIFIFEDHF